MPVAIYPMKKLVSIFFFVFLLMALRAEQQESAVAPPRTPEQEALMQTNKMRQELSLTDRQEQEIYEINLRHARERQTSTSRSEALKRVKNKENELQQVLTRQQYERLQEKRVDYRPAVTHGESFLPGRTRPVTNPVRTDGSRVIPSEGRTREGSREGSRTIPSEGRTREESRESSRTQPEGTRYIPGRSGSSVERSASPVSRPAENSSNRSSGTSSQRSTPETSGQRTSSETRR